MIEEKKRGREKKQKGKGKGRKEGKGRRMKLKTIAPTFEYCWKTTRRWENERDARTWLNLQTENILCQWTSCTVNNERGRAAKQHDYLHPRQLEKEVSWVELKPKTLHFIGRAIHLLKGMCNTYAMAKFS